MKHTTGPWRISDARSTKVVLIDDAKGQAVGELVWADVRNPADARLIAAAPDLLEALKAVAGWNANYPSHRIYSETSIRQIAAEMDAINEKARAAIAKAEGD